MTRTVVNVATTPYYQRGQARLEEAVTLHHGAGALVMPWGAPEWKGTLSPGAGEWPIPKEWPTHEQKPYAFKAYAMQKAAESFDLLLWCDSSILPIRSMEPLWERIESQGYWFSANGYTNYEWTADSAYPDLFADGWVGDSALPFFRKVNRDIPHVVATAFGINVKHPKGKAFLDEYFRLASETNAFCGAWINTNSQDWNLAHPSGATVKPEKNARQYECGAPDVRGHRHDQTAASVIAWRLGMELTTPPIPFSYGKAGDTFDEGTILIADGSYL